MLALFDAYDDATKELLRSLHAAGLAFTPVVIRYEGELPDGAACPFTTYTGIEREGEPLFFDEVPVPAWCEIRQGKEAFAQILRDGYPIGRINYEPNSFRQVESVDWLLPDRTTSHTDHYDRYGNRYATTHYSDGLAYQTEYEGPGEWTIEVDHVSRIVTMRASDQLRTFATLTDFVSSFLDEQRLADDDVLINSLSYPLFVARARAATPNTTLFWQEAITGEVPGNMAAELERPTALTRIVFCDEQLRQQVAARYPDTAVELHYLSHLAQFAPRDGDDPRRAFILTRSDEIPGLEELAAALPQVTFAVAAPTLMSDRLHELGRRHANVTLIPSITHGGIREELGKASVYLDINAGPHVLDVVKAAYYLDLVVLALAAQAKAPGHSLVLPTPAKLIESLSAVVASPRSRARARDELHTQHGPLSTPEEYRDLFGAVGQRARRPGSVGPAGFEPTTSTV